MRITLSLRLARLVPVVGLAVTGCTEGGPSQASESAAGGPQLQLIDSLTLHERDTAYIGAAGELAVDPSDGSYYVADFLAERVLRFDRRGVLLATYGSKGHGPGEIAGIGSMLVADSTLYVAGAENARIEGYVRYSGEPSGAFQLAGYVTSFAQDGAHAWLGNYEPRRRTGVTVWEINTEEFRHMISIPAEYERAPALGGTFPSVLVAPFGDSLVIGFMGTPYLLVATKAGTVTDTVWVPVQRRRPYPADVGVAMQARAPERIGAISALAYASIRPTREMMLIHFDAQLREGLRTTRVYVSLLSADRRQACVDAELAVSQDGLPTMAIRGDTLFVLEGHVEDRRARNTVKRYLISNAGCDWVPTT